MSRWGGDCDGRAVTESVRAVTGRSGGDEAGRAGRGRAVRQAGGGRIIKCHTATAKAAVDP